MATNFTMKLCREANVIVYLDGKIENIPIGEFWNFKNSVDLRYGQSEKYLDQMTIYLDEVATYLAVQGA